MNTDKIIAEVSDLPLSQRVEIARGIIKTFDKPVPDIEKAWAKEVERRVKEFESGDGKAIPGEQVIERLEEKYSQ
jgi:putative addiction module component (TIGR02574 family)